MTEIGNRGVVPAGGSSLGLRKVAAASAARHTLRSRGNRVTIVRDRRRHQRVKIQLLGRFMREDKNEFPCQVHNVSAGGLAVSTAVSGEPGEKIVLYLEQLGRLEGKIVRVYPGGFAMLLSGSNYKREKIVNQLTWLLNRNQLDMSEERQHLRTAPSNSVSKLVMADGSERECQILDVSLGGASISIHPKPELNIEVSLSLIRGRVARHHEHGVGIQFEEIQDPASIERRFGFMREEVA